MNFTVTIGSFDTRQGFHLFHDIAHGQILQRLIAFRRLSDFTHENECDELQKESGIHRWRGLDTHSTLIIFFPSTSNRLASLGRKSLG